MSALAVTAREPGAVRAADHAALVGGRPPAAGRGPRRPQLTVDLDAVAHNVRLFAERAGGGLMAVVKADGFGHGGVAIARTAVENGATWLGVTSIEEGLDLRAEGVDVRILSWLNTVDADFPTALAADIDLAVPSREHLDAVVAATGSRYGVRRRARVHLHVDCGMARDGAPVPMWASLCRAARDAERLGLIEVVAVMGHLGCADDPADRCNELGRACFEDAVVVAALAGLHPSEQHLAATAATLADRRTHRTMCRVGAGLVGIDPTRTAGLRPALTLRASVVGVRDIPASTAVGYGHSWRAPAPTRCALVPLGYADGLPLAASNRAAMWVRGRRCPVVGRISMDQTVLDVGDLPVRPGDEVVAFGPGTVGEPTVAQWAGWAATIEHEIVTGIGARVERVVLPATPRGCAS